MTDEFFDEQTEQSRIKTEIVTQYIWAWARVIIGTQTRTNKPPQIAYLDLYSGPGQYDDGSASTPLQILREAIQEDLFRTSLVTFFNDRDPDNCNSLQQVIDSVGGIETLTHKPIVNCQEAGIEVIRNFQQLCSAPTLMFVDPWGYKGLSLELLGSVLRNWACECIFFFNYNRINPGLNNPAVKEHMDDLFGVKQAESLRNQLEKLLPQDREPTIIEALANSLKTIGGRYVLPFCFKNEKGTRTSHHLIFVTKHVRGYEIMKVVMANQSSKADQGVPSFTYNPADERQPLLFELTRPLDDLEEMLLREFAGRTMSMEQIYNAHHVGRRYIEKNYKELLTQLELAGKITANPTHSKRPARKGKITFGPKVLVTFPKKD